MNSQANKGLISLERSKKEMKIYWNDTEIDRLASQTLFLRGEINSLVFGYRYGFGYNALSSITRRSSTGPGG